MACRKIVGFTNLKIRTKSVLGDSGIHHFRNKAYDLCTYIRNNAYLMYISQNLYNVIKKLDKCIFCVYRKYAQIISKNKREWGHHVHGDNKIH